MRYEEFKQKVVEDIKGYLPEEFEDHEVKIQTIEKLGSTYDGLIIRKEENMSVCPVVNLNAMYDAMTEGGYGYDYEGILEKIAHIRLSVQPDFDKNMMLKFDRAEDRIYPRLVNTAANADYLKDKVKEEIADLTIMYAVRISETSDGVAEAPITQDLLKLWKVSYDDIKEAAYRNLEVSDYVFMNLEDVIFGGMKKEFNAEIESIDPDDYNSTVFILTNKHNCKGAAMILDDYLMTRIVNTLGDVYILPSSVDEVLVVPASRCDENAAEALGRMVIEVNQEAVKPEDRLSDRVYRWSIDGGLELA